MENLTRKQQAMWPVIESGRQVLAFFKWPLKKWAEYGVEVDRRLAVERELDNLLDPGLIDRILQDRSGGPEIQEVEKPAPRPMRSLDGILRAV